MASRERNTFNEINITPLTDIFLVLLIIMMVIAPLLDQQGLNLAVPNNVEVQDVKQENKLISVTVTDDDKYYIDENEVAVSQLEGIIKQKSKEFPTIPTYKPELSSWILNQAKIYNLKLTPDAVSTLISMVGNNLRQLDSEIQKLAISVYPKDTAGDKNVREICTNNEDLFALSDALMQMDYETALLEYKKLLDKDHPIKILATLQTMARRWVTLKANSKASPFELLKLTGMNEYVIKLTLQKMKNTTLRDLVTLKKNLTTCEYRIKSGQALDVEREVANAFLVR